MKDIIKELEQVRDMGYEPHRVFSDWLDLMLYAFLKDEDYYLALTKRYRNGGEIGEREIDYFENACGLLMDRMKGRNEEILGEIFMQWDLGRQHGGTYFTPPYIASFMAQIAAPAQGEVINDPCCGSGIMLIESCKLIDAQALYKTLFIAQDINPLCVKMCALNMLFFNLNALIIQGDTLKLEYRKVYETSRSPLGGSIRLLTEEEIEVIKPKVSAKIPTPVSIF